MKTKSSLLAVMLLILVNSTIFGLRVPTRLSPTGNQTKILLVRECELNLKPYQDLGVRSRRFLQKSAVSAFPQYEEHESIVIKSDADFAALGFPGDGSLENPYVIEGLNITRSTTPLIQIEDTAVYFHIKNNFLNGLTSEAPIHDGIHLIYVSHGTVASNIITKCEVGILIDHSKDIIVSHNTVSNNRIGIDLSYSEYNIISHNTIFNSSLCGIYLATSGNNTVSHNKVSNTSCYEIGNFPRPFGPFHDGTGIYLATSGNNTVSNNTISNNICDGIRLWNSSDTIISYNTVLTNGGTGIFIEMESGNNVISNNTISNNGRTGIFLWESGQNTLLGNNLVNNGLIIDCFKIEECLKTNVTDNMVNGRPLVYWQNVIGDTVPPGAGQVILINTTAVEVTGQDLSRASIGLFATFSSNLHIHHNTASNNSVAGIHLRYVGNSALSHNTVSNNTCDGVLLEKSGNNTISQNDVSNNQNGIHLSNSGHSTLFNNTVVSNNQFGIYIWNSGQNTLLNNNLVNNGLLIDGNRDQYLQGNVADNMVNGRPLVYWQNVIGGTVPPGAGQVILINTTSVEVTMQNLSRASIGLFVAFSSNLYIHHNTVSNNILAGIYLETVRNITLFYNTISNNTCGIIIQISSWDVISLQYGGNHTLSHNTISNNSWIGIVIGCESNNNGISNNTVSNNGETGIVIGCGSNNNDISNNTVSNNGGTGIYIESDSDNNGISNNIVSNNGGTGIFLWNSEQNTVKWNDFLGNNPGGSSQARDDGTNNVFTSNYWDDHDNTDRDGNGLADAPYAIEGTANNQDPSPLAVPAVIKATTLPKVPGFEGFLIFVVIPFILWLRRRPYRR